MHKIATFVLDKAGVVIDIPRSNYDEDKDRVICSYTTIEQLKNGHIFTTRYEGIEACRYPKKVVVFSNHYPDTTKMSKDRWRIAQIIDKRLHFD